MPLRFFLLLPGCLVVPDFRRGQVQRRDRRAPRCVTQLRIASEIADQDDLVHTTHTLLSPLKQPALRLLMRAHRRFSAGGSALSAVPIL
jgi:hypothetical protein